VYWVILRRPASPSFLSASSVGDTTVMSCMMMEAEMYGMMPQREDREPRQRPSREHVEHVQDAAARLVEQARELVRIDPRGPG
jgi:hypothetical protein